MVGLLEIAVLVLVFFQNLALRFARQSGREFWREGASRMCERPGRIWATLLATFGGLKIFVETPNWSSYTSWLISAPSIIFCLYSIYYLRAWLSDRTVKPLQYLDQKPIRKPNDIKRL